MEVVEVNVEVVEVKVEVVDVEVARSNTWAVQDL